MIIYKRFGDKNLSKKELIFNTILRCLIPSILFFLVETSFWIIGGVYAIWCLNNGKHLYSFVIWGIDDKIPIIPEFLIFYVPALVIWTIGVMYIFLVRGENVYWKFLSISFIVFFISLVLYLIFPADSKDTLATWGVQQLKGRDDFFARNMFNTLGGNGEPIGFSAYHSNFPSMHCSCTILVLFGMCSNFFSDKVYKNMSKWRWYIHLTNAIFFVYTILVCASTFILKQHFFVDWILSLSICVIVWNCYNFSSNYLKKRNINRPNIIQQFFTSLSITCNLSTISSYPCAYSWSKKVNFLVNEKIKKKSSMIVFDLFVMIIIAIVAAALILIPTLFGSDFPLHLYKDFQPIQV